MATMEKLIAALDPLSQQSIYTFAKGEEFDQSLKFLATSVPLEGRDYGYDALGTLAAPVAPRLIVWKFIHPFIGTETYTTIRNALVTAIGQGRPILLQKQLPDSTLQLCDARCVDIPDKALVVNDIWVEYTLTFQQRGDWFTASATNARYDTGLKYDVVGQKYDQRGIVELIAGSPSSFTLTNGGTTTEWDAAVTFQGPLTGPMNLYNLRIDPRGVPFAAGTTGTNLRLSISVSLTAGQYITIDSKTNAITTNVPNLVPWTVVTKAPGQRYYWGIAPGANSCRLDQSANTSGGAVNFVFHSRWR